jgi:hypothetical protein
MCRSSQQVEQPELGAAAHTEGAVNPLLSSYQALGRLHASLETKVEYEWQERHFYTYPIMDPAAVRC